MLRPFFTYYGGKYRAAPKYPVPKHDTIIEPFAGSAGYSLRYPNKRVVLVDLDPIIASTWQYLTQVSPEEVLSLPDLGVEETVDDLKVCEEAKYLIGWWLNKGSPSPCKSPSKWMRDGLASGEIKPKNNNVWGVGVRERIASQVTRIRHWKIINGTYESYENSIATWFVDPPYQKAGKFYKCGSSSMDYIALGEWCKTRQGQVLVCENEGATWLPFQPFLTIKANESKYGGKTSKEVLWKNYEEFRLFEPMQSVTDT